jgi:hypothetical protein
MASPFRIFRKHQKLMLALLTILAMFAFVFLQYISDFIGSTSHKNPVAFKSKYGNLRESELAWLRAEKLRFLQVLTGVAAETGISSAYARYYIERQFGGDSEDVVVNTWLMARRAESLGMVVDNAAINQFLKQFSNNSVTAHQFQKIFDQARITANQFFAVARDQLLARKLQQTFMPSVDWRSTTPAQRWDYFCRLKRKASVETVALPVDNYIDQIEAPDETELKKFFEDHKEQLPLPYSPTPGFKRPAMAALEYVMADFEKFSSAEAIPDAEVLQRYEKDKARYDEQFKKRAEKPAAEEPKAEKAEKKSAEEPKAEEAKKKSAEEPKAEETEKKRAEKPKAEETEKKPAEEPKTEKPAEPASPAAEKPAEPNPVAPPAAEQGPKDSLADADDPPPPQEPEKQPDVPPTPNPPVEKQPEAPPVAKEPAEKQPEAPPVAKTPEADNKDAAKQDEQKPAPGALTDEQKKIIRNEIAIEKINALFEQLRKQMADYRLKWRDFHSATEKKGQGKIPVVPPTPPDFDKFAADNGLVAGRTPLLPRWELQKTEIGQTLVGGQVPTTEYAIESMTRYRSEEAVSLNGNPYLFWKTDETREDVPKFDDEAVWKEVLLAWKMVHARALARKAAEELATKANEAKKPLKELLADQPKMKVVLPAPFTWLTFGNVAASLTQPRRPQLVDVPELNLVGDDFMRKVFSLQPGESGAAMNAPQTIAYVIRLIEYTPSYRVLWDQFTIDDFVTYAEIAAIEQQRIEQAWLEEIKSEADFHWMPEHQRQRTVESDAGNDEED